MSWGHEKVSFKRQNPEKQKVELLHYKQGQHSNADSSYRSTKGIHEYAQNDKKNEATFPYNSYLHKEN